MTGFDDDQIFDLCGGYRRDPAPLRDPLGDLGEALDALAGRLGALLRAALAYGRRRPILAALRVTQVVSVLSLVGWLLWIAWLAYVGRPR